MYPQHRVEYSIRIGANGRPSLYRATNGAAAQELIEGIEDMQILYGEDYDINNPNGDGDGDGLPNRYVPANFVDPSGNPMVMDNVKGLRITLLAQSTSDGLMTQSMTHTYASGSGSSGADGKSKTLFVCPKNSTTTDCPTPSGIDKVVYDGRIRNIYDTTLAIRNRLK